MACGYYDSNYDGEAVCEAERCPYVHFHDFSKTKPSDQCITFLPQDVGISVYLTVGYLLFDQSCDVCYEFILPRTCVIIKFYKYYGHNFYITIILLAAKHQCDCRLSSYHGYTMLQISIEVF